MKSPKHYYEYFRVVVTLSFKWISVLCIMKMLSKLKNSAGESIRINQLLHSKFDIIMKFIKKIY